LFADRDVSFGRKLVVVARGLGIHSVFCETADAARRALVSSPPSVFCANVRLGGLKATDLVHLARMANPNIRVILYGHEVDLVLGREAQRAGAFFELRSTLLPSLPHYFASVVPRTDRRNAVHLKRRHEHRGGRRASDELSTPSLG
jgi:DNA-binding NtrC family response regulator